MNNKEIDRLLCEISEGDNGAFERLYEETRRLTIKNQAKKSKI